MPSKFEDRVLVQACIQHAHVITREPFTHESLLIDKKEYQLSAREKEIAFREYHHDKRYFPCSNVGLMSRYSTANYLPPLPASIRFGSPVGASQQLTSHLHMSSSYPSGARQQHPLAVSATAAAAAVGIHVRGVSGASSNFSSPSQLTAQLNVNTTTNTTTLAHSTSLIDLTSPNSNNFTSSNLSLQHSQEYHHHQQQRQFQQQLSSTMKHSMLTSDFKPNSQNSKQKSYRSLI